MTPTLAAVPALELEAMPKPPPPPLALVTDNDGLILSASGACEAELGRNPAGMRCRDLLAARGLDGTPVCTQTCLHEAPRPPVPVRIDGSVWRMVCAGAGDQRVVLLENMEGEPGSRDHLSLREREVLGLIALGLTNERIARRLSISRATVRTHVEHILDKLKARTRTAAVARAIQLRIIAG